MGMLAAVYGNWVRQGMRYCLVCTLLLSGQSGPGAAQAHHVTAKLCWIPALLCRHTAFQLLKLETITNVLNMGYSALWVEPHALLAGTCCPC